MRLDIKAYCFLSIILLSCAEDDLPPQFERTGLNYFPLEVGSYRIYSVYEINITTVSSDTNNFQLREAVVDSFLNADNDYTHIIHRSVRSSDTVEWKLDSVWSARRTASLGIMVENNVPVIKIVFPIEEDKQWDGNSFSTRPTEIFRMENVSTPYEISDLNFDKTLTVIQSDVEDNLIIQDQRTEVYAQGVGLVHKDFVTLNFCSRDDCLGQGIIDSGRVLQYDLIEYGKE